MRDQGCFSICVIGIILLCILYSVANSCQSMVASCNARIAAVEMEKAKEQARADDYAEAKELIEKGDYQKATSLLYYLKDYQYGEVLYTYAYARNVYES